MESVDNGSNVHAGIVIFGQSSFRWKSMASKNNKHQHRSGQLIDRVKCFKSASELGKPHSPRSNLKEAFKAPVQLQSNINIHDGAHACLGSV